MQNMKIIGKFLVVLGLFQESQGCSKWDTPSIESDKVHKKEVIFLDYILNRGPHYELSFQRAWSQIRMGILGTPFISLRHFTCFPSVTFMK